MSHLATASRACIASRSWPCLRKNGVGNAERVRTFARTQRHATAAATAEVAEGTSESDKFDSVKVKSAEGVRIRRGEKGFELEFLLAIEEPDVKIWVPADNVAEDVRDDYEAAWWRVCRAGDVKQVEKMLKGGGQALVSARDSDGRSGLHYACGVGSEECVRMILSYGAEVDAKDKDSFTPLHIAAGYLHEKVVEALVQSGANPELQDSTGRSPLDLVETLQANTPATTVTFARRSVLDSIVKTLEQYVFEEVPPAEIKASRTSDDDQKEYLVQWLDEFEDSWVLGRDIADDLIEDFDGGLEYAQLSAAYLPPNYSREKGKKAKTKYLVKWSDDATPSWEPKENAKGAAL